MIRVKKNGFSLIELMVTVAIVGILAAIAVPSYKTSIQKARRSEGQASLLKAQAAFEQFYSQNNTYVGAPQAVAGGIPSTTYYSYTSSNVAATTYTITATAIASQTSDTTCLTFSINNASSQTPAVCWGQ